MKQYCSVCKDRFDMEVVEEGGENEVTWLKCPRCKGILPYMKLTDDTETVQADEDEFSAESIAESDVVEYDSQRTYEVGNVVYHRSWNDYGKVVEKLILPGDRQAIRVQFLNQGDVNLLENVPADEG
ncbi:MAG: hypothetical protein GY835_15655 [bacterium]|nr:hypothetical protein [bacterium]